MVGEEAQGRVHVMRNVAMLPEGQTLAKCWGTL